MPTPSLLDFAKPYVVLVLGRPASGKSTLSAKLAERWGLPVVAKDAVKEVLFDVLGVRDVEWSKRLGRASFAVLDYVIELQLQTGMPFLIDAAYTAEFENAKFRQWQQQYGFEAVQILCTASPDEIGRRFVSRAHDGTRHPGHADEHRIEEFRETLNDERFGLLGLRGVTLGFDSDQPGSEEKLLNRLATLLPR